MAGPPNAGVAVIASPSGASYDGARSNPAMELANALAPVERSLGGVLDTFAKQKKESAAKAAHQDALSNSGEAYKDAVAGGRLKPTSSPWYMEAYEQDAAAMRGQGQMADLIAHSQTWSERNDPEAYQARLHKEAGALGEAFQGPAQQDGLQSVANPLLQQALASNAAYNSQRIQQESVQAVTTLASQALVDLRRTNPKATPEDYFKALQASHDRWTAVGNSEAAWRDVTVGAFTAAAYKLEDGSILDALKTSPLFLEVSADGTPRAQQIEQAQYYVNQSASNAGMAETRTRQNQVKAEGAKAEQAIWDKYGYGFIEGTTTKAEMLSFLKEQGYSPQAAQAAFDNLAEHSGKNTALTRGQMSGDTEILALSTEAITKGISPGLSSKLSEFVRVGRMTLDEAQQIQGQAQSRTNHLESEGRSDARQAQSDARADSRDARSLTLKQSADLKVHRERQLGAVSSALARLGDRSITNGPGRTTLANRLEDAEGAYLATHPDDYDGASKAVEAEANSFLSTRIAARQKSTPGASSKGVNGNTRR